MGINIKKRFKISHCRFWESALNIKYNSLFLGKQKRSENVYLFGIAEGIIHSDSNLTTINLCGLMLLKRSDPSSIETNQLTRYSNVFWIVRVCVVYERN